MYLKLAGTHVDLVPTHYARRWVDRGEIVPVGPDIFRIVSDFHAVRLKSATPSVAAELFWQ